MSAIITDSKGYEGTIQEPDWARLMVSAAGRRYGVINPSDWKVTSGAADREVRIAPGSGFGSGVIDRTLAAASLSLPAPASGSRWHLIVVRRDWQANASSFTSIPGGTGAAALPEREATPGTLDDQPLALVRVQAGQSQVVEIRDLRIWGGDGGAFAVDDLVRQFNSRLGTSLVINGVMWNRVLDNLGNAQWVSMRQPDRGSFVGATSPTGTATVDHTLGVVPASVQATDRNAGAVPGSRKVVFVTATTTQIQFVVYNNGSPLPNNPVEFDWLAVP